MSFGKTDLGKNFSPEERFCEYRSDFLGHKMLISAKTSTILHVAREKRERQVLVVNTYLAENVWQTFLYN